MPLNGVTAVIASEKLYFNAICIKLGILVENRTICLVAYSVCNKTVVQRINFDNMAIFADSTEYGCVKRTILKAIN